MACASSFRTSLSRYCSFFSKNRANSLPRKSFNSASGQPTPSSNSTRVSTTRLSASAKPADQDESVRLKPKILALAVGVIFVAANAAGQQFQLMEASVSDIRRATQSGKLTCHSLVQQYLDRIEAYDQQGPTINAMLYVNPKALEQADAMDQAFKRGAKLKPLQCIPLVLKDVFDTADMPTTGGSLALKEMQPAKDGFTVVRFRQAGALILGKTNMHELALAGVTVSSLGGQTKNPYELTRTPGGSSGGTGAALAANFATVGTGSDTVNSIRSPSSANSL